MQLSTYLKRNGISYRDFAETIGLTPEGVRLLATGQRQPRRATMDRIVAATASKVRARDFLFETPQRKTPPTASSADAAA